MRNLPLPLATGVLFLMHCAGQAPPPGGPVDTIPPVIIRSAPDSGAVRFRGNSVELEFSEYVDRRSVEDAVFISPPVGQLEFDWSGKEVEIIFPDTLRPNTTYVLTVGTDVIDQRAKNRMASGHTVAFSTGDSLDRGKLSGRVYDREAGGITVFAYRLDSLDPDTLNPSRVKPHYVMQTGDDGTFILSSLAWGQYRVFAVRDEYRNLLYDPQLDQFGVFSRDVELSAAAPFAERISFRMTVEDTTAPFLSSVQAVSGRRASIRFSEPIDTAGFGMHNVTVVDTVTMTPVAVQAVFIDPAKRSEGGVLFRSLLAPDGLFRLTVTGVSDTAGRPIDTMNATLLFTGSAEPDTVAPSFTFLSFADTVAGYPLGRPFDVRFNETVEPASAAGFALRDTAGNRVPLTADWLSPVWLRLSTGEGALRKASPYEMRVTLDSLIDSEGNRVRDSVRTFRFATFNAERTGELLGTVNDLNLGAAGPVVVRAIRITDKRETVTVVETPGPFRFAALPGGAYTIAAFRDEDRSGRYTYGLPFPYQPSERFAVGMDTVKVRPRWSVEGLSLIIP